jgi:hypothetical protein
MRNFVLLLFSVLVGCAGTGYHPVDTSGGYADTRLGDGLFQITFRANSYTPQERVDAYVLFRAAQVARQEQADRFIVRRQRIAAIISRPGMLPVDQRTTSITIELIPEGGPAPPPELESYRVDSLLNTLPLQFPDLPSAPGGHASPQL